MVRRAAAASSDDNNNKNTGDPLRAATGIRPSLHPVTINALAEALKQRAQNRPEVPLRVTDDTPPLQVAMAAGKIASDALQKRRVMRRMVATNRIGSTTPLNTKCGAVYVLSNNNNRSTTFPTTTWYNTPPIGKVYCAALSGDADRVVFFGSNTTQQHTWTRRDTSLQSTTRHDTTRLFVLKIL